ncbi:MAG: hypothetical protein QM487_07750, partial [Candidatus Marithrix sp.]
ISYMKCQYSIKINWICNYNCRPINCLNFKVCKQSFPSWMLGYHGEFCDECHNLFKESNGKLRFSNKIDCPICLDIKDGCAMPRCNHYICLDCFKTIYFETSNYLPSFPFPRIENYYDRLHNNLSDMIQEEHPEIKISSSQWNIICAYEKLVKKWSDKFKIRSHDEFKILDKCPLCRL